MNKLGQLSSEEVKTLRDIFLNPDVTRLELLDFLQVSHLTISKVIKKLEQQDYIYKSGKNQGESGRPSTTYRMIGSSGTSLGIHFNFDIVSFVLTDMTGEIILKWDKNFSIDEKKEIQQSNPVHQIKKAVIEGLEYIFESNKSKPVTLGLSLPGLIDSEKGTWISGLQIEGIQYIPIKQILEEQFLIPVFVEDSSRSLLILEKIYGKAKKYKNTILLYLGSGMGAGIMINNRIIRGNHGTAGEIGHVSAGEGTYRCSCGNIGCFETLVSPYGILRIFTDQLSEGVSSTLQQYKLGNKYEFTLENILEAADKGDHFTIKTLIEVGNHIGDACDILIKLFNPEILIISGVGSIFADYLSTSVNNTINLKIAPQINRDFQVVFSDYKPHFEAWGSAMVAVDEFLKKEIKQRK